MAKGVKRTRQAIHNLNRRTGAIVAAAQAKTQTPKAWTGTSTKATERADAIKEKQIVVGSRVTFAGTTVYEVERITETYHLVLKGLQDQVSPLKVQPHL